MRSKSIHLTILIALSGALTACEEEKVPRSVTEFVENPIMLEAAMVRCSQDRTATRYDAECINARQAVTQIEAKEEAARRQNLEARSEAKRQALRRTQEAAAEARRRAAEAERLREEAEYLAQFGVTPQQDASGAEGELPSGNLPMAVVPQAQDQDLQSSGGQAAVPAMDGGNAPVVQQQADPEPEMTDLESIRDELQRRNEEGSN